MSAINPDVEPRYYASSQTIQWSAESDVREVATNRDGIPPAISEYIAYDDLDPPNPFLAVTQDGNGNVVYDGGFPKFYNRRLPDTLATTFDGLDPSFKFLYNALNFTANPDKPKHVLVIGNSLPGESYGVKETAEENGSGFRSVLEYVADVAGFDVTIKDRSDWGGVVDVTLSELGDYACLIVMGTRSNDDAYNDITEAGVQEIVTYRQQGNGIILITDHGPELADIAEAQEPHSGYFAFTNRIAVNFGAYFTGKYDRTDVNVGFLRSTYGDHPLYVNMDDSEDIHAGGSESKVVVTETETVSPGGIPDTVLDTPGKHVINFLAIKDNGDAETLRFAYTITDGEFIFFQRWDGEPAGGRGLTTIRPVTDAGVRNTDTSLGTVQGTLWYDKLPIAAFSSREAETTFTWTIPGQVGIPLVSTVTLDIELESPVRYRTEQTLSREVIDLTGRKNLAHALQALNTVDGTGLTPQQRLASLQHYGRHQFQDGSCAGTLTAVLPSFQGDSTVSYPPLTLPVLAEGVALEDGLTDVDTDTTCVISHDGTTFALRQPGGEWIVGNVLLSDVLLGPREITSSITGNQYYFDNNGWFPQ